MEPWQRIPSTEARRRADEWARLLAADPRIRLVFLFGSAADPGQTAVRDIDLAILTEPELSLDELLRLRADLVLRMGEGLDLVSLNRDAILLHHEVAVTGCCLYAADPDLETEWVTRAQMRYLDWKPFLETQWRLAGERLEERLRTEEKNP
jgi:predicted nucleotidyltransferase